MHLMQCLGGGFNFYFHPCLGKWSTLTNIFQVGWNHQLECVQCLFLMPLQFMNSGRLWEAWGNLDKRHARGTPSGLFSVRVVLLFPAGFRLHIIYTYAYIYISFNIAWNETRVHCRFFEVGVFNDHVIKRWEENLSILQFCGLLWSWKRHLFVAHRKAMHCQPYQVVGRKNKTWWRCCEI